MKISKITFCLLLAITIIGQSGYSQTSATASSCDLEHSQDFVKTVKGCSLDDLNRFYIEAKTLQKDLELAEAQLQEQVQLRGKNILNHKETKIIFVGTSIVGVITGLFAIIPTMYTVGIAQAGGIPTAEMNRFADRRFLRFGIPTVIAALAAYVANNELKRLEVEFDEIPKLQEFITKLKYQGLPIRITLLENALKIKASLK